jgi:hypothetical protein
VSVAAAVRTDPFVDAEQPRKRSIWSVGLATFWLAVAIATVAWIAAPTWDSCPRDTFPADYSYVDPTAAEPGAALTSFLSSDPPVGHLGDRGDYTIRAVVAGNVATGTTFTAVNDSRNIHAAVAILSEPRGGFGVRGVSRSCGEPAG